MTGVLPIALEEATKVIQALLLSGKEYVCVMRLHTQVPEERIRAILDEFCGTIYQRPPIRASVKRKLRTRKIYYLNLLETDRKNVLFKVGCEAGTYIRKLCVTGDTELILYNSGFQKIKDLNDREKTPSMLSGHVSTISMDDSKVAIEKITRAYKLHGPSKLIRIITDSGVPVKVTPDHEVLISTINGPTWVPACSIRIGELVYSPRRIPIIDNTPSIVDLLDDEMYVMNQEIRNMCIKGIKDRFRSIREMSRKLGVDRKTFYCRGKTGIRIKYVKSFCEWSDAKKLISIIKTERGRIIEFVDKQITNDWMYLLGLIASDGCVIRERKCIRSNRLKFHNSDQKLINTFIMIHKRLFPNIPLRIKPLRNNMIEIDTHNPVMAGVAYSLGIRRPERFMDLNGIFVLPEELIKAFLKGYFDGDGLAYFGKKGKRTYTTIEFCTGFQLIAKRMHQLLKRLGIRSKIFQRKPTGRFRSSEGFVYSVRIADPIDKLRFIEEIGSNHPKKKECFRKIRRHFRKRKATDLSYVPLHLNQMIASLLTTNHLTPSSLRMGGNFERVLKCKKAMTKYLLGRVIAKLSKFLKKSEIEPLLQIFHSDFFVERVKKIQQVEPEEEYVYDVTVENTHNFIPEGAMVVSNCYDLGEALGCGAHMRELRRTRAGPFLEDEGLVTLHDVSYMFTLWQETNDEVLLRKFIYPMEEALKPLPKIYIRDSAVDALCHGAHLAAPGVLSLETGIKPKDAVAVFTQKGEAVSLARALASTEEILRMDHGLVAKTQRVLMSRGVYPKMWRSGL